MMMFVSLFGIGNLLSDFKQPDMGELHVRNTTIIVAAYMETEKNEPLS